MIDHRAQIPGCNYTTSNKKHLFSARLLIAAFFYIFIFLPASSSFSNPLLNVNTEEYVVYDNLLSSKNSCELSTTVFPFSYYKVSPFLDSYARVQASLNAAEDPGFYIKPLNSVTVKYVSAQEKNSFIEGQSGLKLVKGSNLFLFEDGYISLGSNLVFYCQLKQTFTADRPRYDLFRSYAKLLLYKFSFEAGIDNVNIGPGEYGLLLSNNASPYPLVKFTTEDSLSFLGKWDFLFLLGKLHEERTDYSNPNLLAARITWKPFIGIELGITRTILYGGNGRPGYRFQEFGDLIIGKNEHVAGSKFENNGYAGGDISLYLPFNKMSDFFKIVKLYYQYAGSKLIAPWQNDNNNNSFALKEPAAQMGMLVSTLKSITRLEYVTTSENFYAHRLYAEGYSYGGLSLGYPYGRNVQCVLVKYRYYFTDFFSAEGRAGGYEQGASPAVPVTGGSSLAASKTVRRYFVSVLGDLHIKNFILESFIRFDKTKGYDEDSSPVSDRIIDTSNSFFSCGISVSLRI